MTNAAPKSDYRGSLKHKNRPARGRKGTCCPEWTHETAEEGFAGNVDAHDWTNTWAHKLFERAAVDESAPDRRFATERGIAFEAKPTNDGTWHGYPVPWEEVPADLKDRWLAEGALTKKELRYYLKRNESDYKWPLETDD